VRYSLENPLAYVNSKLVDFESDGGLRTRCKLAQFCVCLIQLRYGANVKCVLEHTT